MRESFTFYKSFAEGLKCLDNETRLMMLDAIIDYALYDKEPQLSGLGMATFLAWKANIDASNMRKDNGAKGGRPKASVEKPMVTEPETNGFEDENQWLGDEKPNKKETEKETITETVTEKETRKAPKHKHGRHAHVLLTDEEAQKLAEEYGADQAEAAIEFLDEYIERKGYTAKSHYLCIRKWVFNAMHEEQVKQQELAQREKRLTNGPPGKKPGIPEVKAGIQHGTDFDSVALAQLFGG